MNIPTIIATVERLVRLENGVAAKKAAGEAALAKQLTAISDIEESLPTNRSETFMWLVRQVAEARVERDRLERDEEIAAAALSAAQEASKGNAWKWGARKDAAPAVSKEVAAAAATLSAIKEKLTALNKRVEPLVALIKKEMQVEEDAAESAAWISRGYTDPVPSSILRSEEKRRREFEADCITLKIPKNHAEWKEWMASRPVPVPAPEPELELWDPADCMLSRVLAGDFSAYFTKPVEEVAIAPVEVKEAPRKKGPKKVSSVEWMQRIIAAKKARQLASQSVSAS